MDHDSLDQYQGLKSPWTTLPILSRLLCVLFFILCVASMHGESSDKLIAFSLLLLTGVLASRLPARFFTLRLFYLCLPVFVLTALGAIHRPNACAWFISTSLRGVLCIGAASLLILTTSFFALLDNLKRTGAPPLFLSLLGMTYRFVFLLADEALRLQRAYRARNGSLRSRSAMRGTGRLAAALYARSSIRADRVFYAMQARGFSGTFPSRKTKECEGYRLVTACLCLLILTVRLYG